MLWWNVSNQLGMDFAIKNNPTILNILKINRINEAIIDQVIWVFNALLGIAKMKAINKKYNDLPLHVFPINSVAL